MSCHPERKQRMAAHDCLNYQAFIFRRNEPCLQYVIGDGHDEGFSQHLRSVKTPSGPKHAVLFRECCASGCILSAECVVSTRFMPCTASICVRTLPGRLLHYELFRI